jgi:hypothetical protein
MRLAIFCFLSVVSTNTFVYGQERCGTVAYMQQLKDRNQVPKDDRFFEDWLKQKMWSSTRSKNQRTQSGPYQIPVVVHIIHKGEAVGVGTNISNAQVLSQINVLNEDFNRLNADASSTPAAFQSVAGSLDIQFVLAKQDPEGLATNGIVRVRGSKDGWIASDNYDLKAQSYWPAEDYLNIWVCDLVDDLVGYAQLPESNLQGLEGSSMNRLTDGVVIWYRAFGSIDDGAFNLSSNFNKGRTATHEIGHYFGLRHIWGDDSGGCGGTDYVDDTPNQAGNSTGCPTHPRSTCSVVNMFQNYMDYTNDACMNLYTAGQTTRMSTVIENSPRRISLLTSNGLLNPGQFAKDAGIKEVPNLSAFLCDDVIEPVVTIRNYGSNPVTSVKVMFSVDGIEVETKTFTVNLAQLAETNVNFSTVNIPAGNHTIEFEIVAVNTAADDNAANNTMSENIIVPQVVIPPFTETFSTFPTGWSIINPDGLKTWQVTTAPRESASNKAMLIDIFNYDESQGEMDMLVTPLIDLSQATVAALEFYVAHGKYPNSNDRLRIVLMQDCQDVSTGTVIYEKNSDQLTTVTQSSSNAFVPTDIDDWRKEFVDLTSFLGTSRIQLAFISISDYGNNIYLDNIGLLTTAFEDVSLTALASPSVVTCNNQPQPTVQIQNVGTEIIQTLKIVATINGTDEQAISFSDLNLARGEAASLQLPSINLEDGENEISFTVAEPNGVQDPTPQNNTKDFTVVVNTAEDRIPLRENFETDFTERWTVVNPAGGGNWESITTNFGNSLYFNGFDNTTLGDEAWLVSPVLDFSRTASASVVFDVSQRKRFDQAEDLRILASLDCGDTFYDILTVNINPSESSIAWKPTSENEWTKDYLVGLEDLAGHSDVRIAFVVTNQNGNNIYLDNIEFFTTNQPNLIALMDQFSIYGYNETSPELSALQITFNLESRQDVRFQVIDMMGRTHADGVLTDVLNQTFPLDFETRLARGVYVIQLQMGGKFYTQKILIQG